MQSVFPNCQDLAFFLDICCGVNSPLSTDVMHFDILVHNSDDLLDSNCFEQLLRLCASGIVAYAGASPSCCEYSRLKLLPNGPPALRTPNHMDGIPGISGSDLLKVQESSLMLHRCIQCLHLTIASGGHGHLEQPKSAMSWDEPIVRQFISQHNCACISMAACGLRQRLGINSGYLPVRFMHYPGWHAPVYTQPIAINKLPEFGLTLAIILAGIQRNIHQRWQINLLKSFYRCYLIRVTKWTFQILNSIFQLRMYHPHLLCVKMVPVSHPKATGVDLTILKIAFKHSARISFDPFCRHG